MAIYSMGIIPGSRVSRKVITVGDWNVIYWQVTLGRPIYNCMLRITHLSPFFPKSQIIFLNQMIILNFLISLQTGHWPWKQFSQSSGNASAHASQRLNQASRISGKALTTNGNGRYEEKTAPVLTRNPSFPVLRNLHANSHFQILNCWCARGKEGHTSRGKATLRGKTPALSPYLNLGFCFSGQCCLPLPFPHWCLFP